MSLATLETPHGNGNAAMARRATVMGALAERYSMDPLKLLDTIKATCIKGNATPEQVQAFLIVANRYGLDPFLKQIHAFAGQGGGIVPIVGIDGWTKIINEQDRFDGMDEPKFVDGDDGKPASCTVTIYVKGRTHPVTITEFFGECHRNTAPWNTMPRRMLRHKTIMQCARIAFGLGGIYDEDEAKDIIEGSVVEPNTAPRGAAALLDKLKTGSQIAAPQTQQQADTFVDEQTGEESQGEPQHEDRQEQPELPPVPADAEQLTLKVADMTGLELDDAAKKLKPQFAKGWDKTSEQTRAAWWQRFCTGQVTGLVPTSIEGK